MNPNPTPPTTPPIIPAPTRGKDLRGVKTRALDNCAAAGLTVTLVAAVERGLNDHELGDIVE